MASSLASSSTARSATELATRTPASPSAPTTLHGRGRQARSSRIPAPASATSMAAAGRICSRACASGGSASTVYQLTGLRRTRPPA